MSHVFTLRLNEQHYDKLKSIANQRGISVALLVREVIELWFTQHSQPALSTLDKAQLKALSETLYIVRAMADKVEPQLKETAKQHAQRVVESLGVEAV